MAKTFEEKSLSETWLAACRALRNGDGQDANLCLVVGPEAGIDARISAALENEVHEMRLSRGSWIDRIADSIFPTSLYRPRAGDQPGEARRHLYATQRSRRSFLTRDKIKPSYFDRFTSWSTSRSKSEEPYNQLEQNVILPLERAKEMKWENRNCMELAPVPLGEAGRLQVHDPERDNRPVGTPCLSHVSFTLMRGKLIATAIYRNHYYITKAYGNLIGLRNLQRFVGMETGYEIGELMCVSSHADLYESGDFTQQRIDGLIRRCGEATASPLAQHLVAA